MRKVDETISLLPFIESEEDGFLLDIPLLAHDKKVAQGYSYPFHIADNSQNFSMIVKAGLKVMHADGFKPLFLLTQRDHYPLRPDDLAPFTNAGIDRIWYETILSYSKDKTVFIVPRQLGRDGKATPFTSLFFCKKVKKFFHPPCPECGSRLDLCKDDDLLMKAALFPYATSLKRYLFCPDCAESRGSHEFYQFSRSAEDQVFTKDRFDLLKAFRKLISPPQHSFPCLDCPGHAECYVTGEKAASHISFFSFYPFHMLFFDAEQISAEDFIPLLSGASLEEVNKRPVTFSGTGRENMEGYQQSPHFFFEQEDRFFLEVLFLKLSFFEAFARALYQRLEKKIFPLVQLSARSIWIGSRPQGSILPFFWNFQVRVIDLIVNISGNHFESARIKNNSIHFLTSLWFYTFLVNKTQGPDAVYEITGRLTEKVCEDPLFSHYDAMIKDFPCVALENIFWNPEERSIPSKWHGIWLKTVLTGRSIFDAGKDQSLKDILDQLINKIEILKQDTKEELFSAGGQSAPAVHPPSYEIMEEQPRSAEAPGPSHHEKQAISLILKKLKTKWETLDENSPGQSLPCASTSDDPHADESHPHEPHTDTPHLNDPHPDLDDDVLETIVLSSQEPEPEPFPEPEHKPEPEPDFADALQKTMILSGPVKEPVAEPLIESGFEDMEKTVILSPGTKPEKDAGFFGENEDLDKTVVIPPKK